MNNDPRLPSEKLRGSGFAIGRHVTTAPSGPDSKGGSGPNTFKVTKGTHYVQGGKGDNTFIASGGSADDRSNGKYAAALPAAEQAACSKWVLPVP